MATNDYNLTIALAGICQAAELVKQISHTGQCDTQALVTSLNSLLEMNPSSTLAVFGDDEANLTIGAGAVLKALTIDGMSSEIMRYMLGCILIARHLMKNEQALNELDVRLTNLPRQLDHFPINSPQVIASLAATYSDLISPLAPRIQVTGSSELLKRSENQDLVRAALLCGVRAAVLWHQVGGKRRHFIFGRARLAAQAKALISRVTTD